MIFCLLLGDRRVARRHLHARAPGSQSARPPRVPAAPNVKTGFSQNFFGFSAQGSAMPAASNRRKPAFTLSGKPELFDELRTRANQSFEIGDALGRQTAGEISLDDLVLDDEFTIHRRRRRAGRSSRSGRRLVHTRGFDTTRSFHRGSNSAGSGPIGPSRPSLPKRTRRKNARRHSGWYLPLVLQDRTGLCCDSYVRKPLRRFTFR